ncbi:hypothetical protein VSO92_11965 [Myroides pelagicus]|uniref:hypothetical protein n=1 Tax=Myroides pelagicus TaxID=270914 RepID=UPI002DB7CF40|nr:hypothetical protein [Myroides pelagicus]MEC4114817.1 hypothetical protein [Myroides pelagicus]
MNAKQDILKNKVKASGSKALRTSRNIKNRSSFYVSFCSLPICCGKEPFNETSHEQEQNQTGTEKQFF